MTRDSDDFIKKTNTEYAAWCATFYVPAALDERGMASLHGLWAWQEQERRRQKAAKGCLAPKGVCTTPDSCYVFGCAFAERGGA